MKLEKAVELNKDVVTSLRQGKRPDHADAVNLGIEALKYTQDVRVRQSAERRSLLPGETKE